MTDDLQQIDSPPRSLLDHPQRFGILPTKWFWRDNDRENWRRIRWWFFVPLLITMAAVYSTGNMLLFMTVPPLVMVLLLGLLEKYIRHRATKRRAMLGQAEQPLMLLATHSRESGAGDSGKDRDSGDGDAGTRGASSPW